MSVVLLMAISAFAVPLKKAKLTVAGFEGTTTLENFPVLVRISETSIQGFSYADCAEGGEDLSFALEDGSQLPYEIDTWNDKGESLVWVKLPSLSSADHSFYMKWKDSQKTVNDPKDVWSKEYIGVWHMSGFNADKAVTDATGNGFNAEAKNTSISTAEGLCKVGAAVKNGELMTSSSGGGLKVPDYESKYSGSGVSFTCSAWIRLPENPDKTVNHMIFDKKLANGAKWDAVPGWFVQVLGKGASQEGDKLKKLRFSATGDTMLDKTPGYIKFAGEWRHVTITGAGGTYRFYVDGVQTNKFNLTVKSSKGIPFVMMCAKDGIIDECRMRNGGISADWVKNEYCTMADVSYLSYSPAESNIGSSLEIAGVPGAIGTSDPGYGKVTDIAEGASRTLTMETTEVSGEGTTKYCLKGWKVEAVSAEGVAKIVDAYDPATDNLQSYEYTHSGMSVFTWIWEMRDVAGLAAPVVVESAKDHIDLSVDVTGIGYSGEPAKLTVRYGIIDGDYLWETEAETVSAIGARDVTLPNLTPGVKYFISAQLLAADGTKIETEPIAVSTPADGDGSAAGSPISGLTLDGTGASTLKVSGSLAEMSGGSAEIEVIVGDSPDAMTDVWSKLSGSALTGAGSFELTLTAEMGSEKYLVPGETYYVAFLIRFSDGTICVTAPTTVTMSAGGGWKYVEEDVNADNSGTGYVTDGIWKFMATRTKNTRNLGLKGTSGAACYGTKDTVLDFTLIKDEQGESYNVVAFSSLLSANTGTKPALYNHRNKVKEIKAPHCVNVWDNACFYDCTALTNVVFAEGVKINGDETFRGCTALQSVVPRTFSTLPKYTFAGCRSLEGSIVLTDSTSIPNSLFNGCASLEEVIAVNAASLESHAFCNCSSITNIELGTVAGISENAFYNCPKLKTDFVQSLLGSSLTRLWTKDGSGTHKAGIFNGCTGLEGTLIWDLPNLSTNVVATELFCGCTNLSAVVFKTPVTMFYTKALFAAEGVPDVHMPAEPPASYASSAVMSSKAPFPKVYLKDNFDEWLAVIDKNGDDLILSEAFNDSSKYVQGRVTWKTITDSMAKDQAMCTKSADGVVTVKERNVLGFIWSDGANNAKPIGGCWVLKKPKNGFHVIVR